MAIASSKCDGALAAQTSVLQVGVGPLGITSVSSAKCDWRVSTSTGTQAGQGRVTADFDGEFGFGRAHISSSKCDWHVRLPSLTAAGREPGRLDEFTAHLGGGTISASSSKCDWTIRTNVFDTRTVAGARVGDFRGRFAGGEASLSSSKCDWSIEVLGDPARFRPPTVHTAVASSKCDFTLTVEFGLRGGPRYRLRAVGSDKCDFRLVDLDHLSDLRTRWERLPLPGEEDKG